MAASYHDTRSQHGRMLWKRNARGWNPIQHRISKFKLQKMNQDTPPILQANGKRLDLVRRRYSKPRPRKMIGKRLFTLVDTYTMTVTLFEATRPPAAVLIGGREGGMQRAVLCSYDWKTHNFCRETVLRMKTMAVDKMFRVDRFSLQDGLQYRASTATPSGAAQQ